MPRAGTTLCHPNIGYVDLTRNPALDTLALNSPLGHFNRDQHTPSLHQTDKNHGDCKVQFLQLQHDFRQNATNTIPHTSDDTCCHLNLLNFSLLNFVSISITSPRVLQHRKQIQYSMLQIKLSIKTPFDYSHLTSSSFYLYLPLNLARGLTTLSEETTQHKHTYVTPIFLANNKLSLATNKPTSPAKKLTYKSKMNWWVKHKQIRPVKMTK